MNTLTTMIKTRGVPHESAAPTLEMSHVSVAYAAGVNATTSLRGAPSISEKYTLEDISFRVETGQRVAIVGPNGAGKSTLFKLIVGTLKPSSGLVNVYGYGPDGHICIGYVPQRNQIDWSFPVTVEDVVMMGRVGQIGFFRWPRRRDWAMVQSSLARVNAVHLAKKQIGELSGGQQQRVFIARALAQEAELLLLDEPLSGLDAPSQAAIFAILDDLSADGVTVLMATHDLNQAAEHFDRVVLLNKRIIAFAPPAAALTPNNLLQAYGGHMHVVSEGDKTVLLTDSCCDEGLGRSD
jgi:ABC-type Mn2+/Zn2+ transport system ATPase subunit